MKPHLFQIIIYTFLFLFASIMAGTVVRSLKTPVKRHPANTFDSEWSKRSYGYAPHPDDFEEAVIQVYAARTRGTKKALEAYPWHDEYTAWPGPNSNTFTAWVGLQVPELRLDLPATAIGKDWRPLASTFGRSASGTGVQFSLYGLLGITAGYEEGIEVNLAGLSIELDVKDLALELPGIGRVW